MTSDELPTPIRELIAQHIRSMDHAEAALILAGERDRAHSVADVAEQQRWAKGTALDILDTPTSSAGSTDLKTATDCRGMSPAPRWRRSLRCTTLGR